MPGEAFIVTSALHLNHLTKCVKFTVDRKRARIACRAFAEPQAYNIHPWKQTALNTKKEQELSHSNFTKSKFSKTSSSYQTDINGFMYWIQERSTEPKLYIPNVAVLPFVYANANCGLLCNYLTILSLRQMVLSAVLPPPLKKPLEDQL